MREIERKIAGRAEKQHGLVTRDQALAAGCTESAVWNLVRAGRWQALAGGVYRLSGTPATWAQRVLAAVLAAGPSAAASHRSAAALLGIPGFDRQGAPEVTTPRTRRCRAPDAVVHRWRPFPDHHVTVIQGIPTTRVARTLVDLAGVVPPQRVERAVDNCLAGGLVTFGLLQEAFTDLAGRGRKGVGCMRALLAARGPLYVAPASELEARFLELVARGGLPDPVRQVDLGDDIAWIGRVDFAYPDVGVVIELDGRRYHSSLLDREADARRDAALLAADWRDVIRLGWDDILHQPGEVVARLRALHVIAAA